MARHVRIPRFEDNFESCIAHLMRLPVEHRRVIRTTNRLERTFVRGALRTKVIPHTFGEKAEMKLMYAASMRAQGWRNVIVTAFEVEQIETLRDHLRSQVDQRHAPRPRAKPAREFTARLGLDRVRNTNCMQRLEHLATRRR